jgi:cell division protein FtsB
MAILGEIRRRARQVAGPVAGISLVVYFSYHLVEGDRGLLAWRQVGEKVRVAQAELAASDAQRTALDRRVNLLRAGHLDPDMLDERARATLNLVAPDERVIFPPRHPE